MSVGVFSINFETFLNYVIVGLSSYLISAYVFCKSQNIKLRVSKLIFLVISGLVLSIAFAFVRLRNYPLSQFSRFLMIPILLSFFSKDREQSIKTLIIGLFSFVFELIISTISYFVVGTFLWMTNLNLSDIITCLICELFTSVLCVYFLSIKRFRRGLQFFHNQNKLGLGLLISSFVMLLKILDLKDNRENDYFFVLAVFGIAVAGVGLYIWIQRSITARYREYLQSQSEEHYKEQLEERDKEIEKQRQSNEFLAKIVHRDNHLMNSWNTAIDAYQNADDNAEKSDLFHEIQTMIKERGELIDREQRETKLLPSTGSLLIDSTINDLFIKAAAHGIDFDMAASAPVSEIIGKYISQTDLQTLLSDHIKDAVIAVEARGDGSGKILLDLSMQNDNYCITIYDNGVAFEPDTLSKLGMERVTTHAESGGSGIGFMTTFETLKKAYASLILTEFDSTMPFTKSVAFRFDGESSFIIQSHRSEELKEKLTRDDVVIL